MSAPAPAGRGLGRIVTASAAGMTLEAYDFLLYGSAAALVFNKLFFPSEDPLVGTMLAFLSYALGFFARPLGGIVFGHFGDRIGRKPLLIVSLVLMGVATFAIGLLPTYAVLGVWAAVLLCTLRLIQGFALGGEWGGAMLLVAERVDGRRRGFWTGVAEAGIPLGNLLATAILAVLAAVLDEAQFLSWGWRIPFLLSAALLIVGFWVRRRVSDAPLFHEARPTKAPAVEALRRFPRQVLTCCAVRLTENIAYYVVTAFVIVYVVEHTGGSSAVVLGALVVANLVQLVATPAFGALSDRVGRRPVLVLGAVGTGAWAFAFFPLLDTGSPVLIGTAMVVGLVFHSALYGPQAAFFAEQFDTDVRYTGMSLSAQLPTLVGGSIAPFIATALLAAFGTGSAVAVYLLAAAVLTTVAALLAHETHRRDLAVPLHPVPERTPS
ncbi:MHS family MFS transporter [Pseudonocardia kujensis]|uniref:MFS transporter n=1 Tax=Pseudonocardia kujensis TaxID=1128675 RepID=UPI001E4EBB17|nr:MFS transporter [Pseudonocardia kujensis]MCE0763604.1 MHS family MFS transporter [Pseudonocardia kujensis]